MTVRLKIPAAMLALLPVVCGASQPATGELPESVERILAAYDMPVEGFSAWVQATGSDDPLLAVNADLPRNPASTIKLLTTFLALESLGPAYRWPTQAYIDGELDEGVLDGDLYIKGYGDPYLVTEKLWLFTQQIRQAGLATIDGDLVIDNSYFRVDNVDPGEFDGQPFRTYNVVPDALLVNFHAVRFIFTPDPVTGRVRVVSDPRPANLEIDNRIRLTDGRCRGFQRGISIDVEPPVYDRVTFSGNYGRLCTPYSLSRTVMRAPDYAFGVFKSVWESGGGEIRGGLRIAPVPDSLPLLAEHESPPLADIIRSINKWSNNVMTRQLLLTMGAERFGPPATVEKGRRAIAAQLAELGLDFPELVVDNGSGLSRDTRISAGNLARLLMIASQRMYRAEFVSSLALAGLDGTMRRRFRNDSMTGRMHLKTGRLDHVFAMAGFVRSASGTDFVVVAIHNETDAHRGAGEEAQSALLRWVFAQ